MKTITISINYTLKWRIKTHQNLAITTCKKMINTRNNRVKKKCVNGGVIGFWLDAKTFMPISKINLISE